MNRRLVLVEDHPTVLEGLALVLAQAGLEVVGKAGTAEEGAQLIASLKPDAAVIDINLPDETGISLTRRLASLAPNTGVLLYTGNEDAELLAEAVESGARGYALKTAAPDETVRAVRAVAAGGTYVDPRIRSLLLERPSTDRVAVLSDREREVLELVGNGASIEQIGERLFISPQTVRTHIQNAMRKMEARTRTHAIVLALRSGELRL
jgi:DNA-binding NarL/FixJ family response regulator